jgi:basic membrane protein A
MFRHPSIPLRLVALGIAVLLLVPLLTACGGPTTIRIGLVTSTAGLHDNGFNQLADQGLQKAVKDLGIQVDVAESKTTSDYATNLEKYASQGYDLVISVGPSLDMQQAVGTVSGKHSNVHFAIIDAYGTDASGKDLKHSNVVSLLFSEQEAGALAGVVSGMLMKNGATPKKTGTISAVGSVKTAAVDRYLAGYKWGAQWEVSSLNVLVNYSNNTADPTKCRDTALTQIGQGAQIVFAAAGGCGFGALVAAGDKGVLSISSDTDQKAVNASVVASAVKHVEVATYAEAQVVKAGNFKGGVSTFDLKNGGVGIAPGNRTLGQDILNEVKSVADKITSGQVTVPDKLS